MRNRGHKGVFVTYRAPQAPASFFLPSSPWILLNPEDNRGGKRKKIQF